MSATYADAHSAVAVAIAERFLEQPRHMAWEQRSDELATAAIEAMQIFISMRHASVDTHAKRGDATQIEAPSPMGSAVPKADAHTQSAIK